MARGLAIPLIAALLAPACGGPDGGEDAGAGGTGGKGGADSAGLDVGGAGGGAPDGSPERPGDAPAEVSADVAAESATDRAGDGPPDLGADSPPDLSADMLDAPADWSNETSSETAAESADASSDADGDGAADMASEPPPPDAAADPPVEACSDDIMTDPMNCGACGVSCFRPHGSSSCSGGACTPVACTAGRVNCDGIEENGCETAGTFCCTFCDDFEGGAGKWTVTSGAAHFSVVTDGSKVYQYAGIAYFGKGAAFAGPGLTDYTVEARIKVLYSEGDDVTLFARYNPTTETAYGITLSEWDGSMSITKWVSGGSTTLASMDAGLAKDTWYTVKLELVGSSLKAYLDGVLTLSASDASITSGVIGVWALGPTGFELDDVIVN